MAHLFAVSATVPVDGWAPANIPHDGHFGVRMSEIRVGTASWTERTLIESGVFYPPDVRTAEGRLKFYARHFDTVEVDSTYYSSPSERNSLLWAERTPPGFLFNIKAYSMLTRHPTTLKTMAKVLRESLPGQYREQTRAIEFPNEILEAAFDMFTSALKPLQDAAKLGCVLFQFPPWFLPGRESYRWLELVREKFPSHCIAVEFRNKGWLDPHERQGAADFLRANGMSYVAVDAPWVTGWMGPVDLTTDISYIRLHGRNRASWFKKGVTTEEKYRYAYSTPELEAWVDTTRKASAQAGLVFVVFNNCYQDYAVKNATMMKRLFLENDH